MLEFITSKINIQYLTGFAGTFGFAVQKNKKIHLFTDSRYTGLAQQLEKNPPRLPFQFIEWNVQGKEKLQKMLAKEPEVFFEDQHLTVSALKNWKKLALKSKWKPTQNPIENLRKIKTEDEIKKLKKSQEINEKVLDCIKKWLKPGMRETEVAWQVQVLAHELGAEGLSFDTIVAFGPNSAVPHHQPTDRKLQKNDLVLMDMGMSFEGYASDMTRSFFMGKPSTEQARVYDLVLRSQEAGIQAVRAGVKCADVDAASREVMGKEARYFTHSLGHGIGMEVHETPSLSSKSKDILEENMIVTVEPGIYLPGKFGVRIEDMGRVTKTGYENFTRAEK